ncbi:SNARE domain protein [Ostertagia ostertagi]
MGKTFKKRSPPFHLPCIILLSRYCQRIDRKKFPHTKRIWRSTGFIKFHDAVKGQNCRVQDNMQISPGGSLYLTFPNDITSLNKQIAALQEFSRERNSGTKNQGTSITGRFGLQSKLASVSKDFQSVLEISTENLKHQKNRREKFSNADPLPTSFPSSSSGSNVRSRLLDDDNQHGVPRVNSVTLDMGAMEQMRVQQQVTLHDQSDAYAQARSTAMETIEGSISELGQIFAQLASLVSEQGEMITRIDSNVEDTAINIDAAHTELVKYFHNISKNRWLMIKVFVNFVMRYHLSGCLSAFGSFVATAATVTNAFVVNKQFYPSIVYITKSNASMMVIYVQALILVYILFQMVRKIFFGELRASEAEVLLPSLVPQTLTYFLMPILLRYSKALAPKSFSDLSNLFPIVSAEDLATMDATCIICRDEMTPESTPKRLPCGMSSIRTVCEEQRAVNARLPPNLFPFMAHQFAVPQPRPPTQDNTAPAAAGGGEGEGRTNDPRAFPNPVGGVPAGFPSGPFPAFPPPFPQDMPQFPPFPFMAPLPPFPMEMPRPPPQLDQLTEEDLRAMEGQSRAAWSVA